MARTEDKCVVTGRNGSQQLFIVIEVVLKIGVLDQDDLAGRGCQPRPDGVAFALGRVLKNERHRGMLPVVLHHFPRAIGRIAFNHDQLQVVSGDPLCDQRIQRRPHGRNFIEYRYDDRNGNHRGGVQSHLDLG